MIEVKDLSKCFGTKWAVNGVSFTVERGEVLGFLGPNGAGKSTTMRMITGFTPPSGGSVRIAGKEITEDPIACQTLMGYLPENAPSYSDMTVSGFLEFAAEIRGLFGAERNKAVERAIEMCFLDPVRHQSIDTLSKGYRHRTCFAQSIIHDPQILILDEPTDGLDPNQKHEIRSLIKRMGEKKAIIFSTHILEEVEAVCSRALIIDRGKVVANGTPAELKQRSPLAGSVRLELLKNEAVSGAKEKLSNLAGVRSVDLLRETAEVLTLRVVPKEEAAGALSQLVLDFALREKWRVVDLHTEEGRLDEVFRQITLPDSAPLKK